MEAERNNLEERPEPSAPEWYRHGWVWFVFLIPFSAVLFGIVMIVSSNYQPDDVVVDNYYKEGMGINQLRAQDTRALELGAGLEMTALTDTGAVFKVLNAEGSVGLSLFHVTDQKQDMNFELVNQGDGIYSLASAEFADRLRQPGVWYVEVKDSRWRLRGRLQTPVSVLVLGST